MSDKEVQNEEVQVTTETDAESTESRRALIVDGKPVFIDELPDNLQRAVAAYDVWVFDRGEAQKKASQLEAAVRQLATQLTEAVRQHLAAESGEAADDQATAELDIPAEDDATEE